MVRMVATRWKRLGIDFAILVGILLAVAVSNAVIETYRGRLGLDTPDVEKAVGCVLHTLLFLVVLIRGGWKLQAKAGFWPRVGPLFLMHLVVLAVVWRLGPLQFLWGLIVVLESGFAIFVLQKGLRQRR